MQAESSKVIARKAKDDMEGSSISEAERIKMDIKRKIPESKITFASSDVTNTNVGLWDYEEFKDRMVVQDLPLVSKRMLESGSAHVACFPSTV